MTTTIQRKVHTMPTKVTAQAYVEEYYDYDARVKNDRDRFFIPLSWRRLAELKDKLKGKRYLDDKQFREAFAIATGRNVSYDRIREAIGRHNKPTSERFSRCLEAAACNRPKQVALVTKVDGHRPAAKW